MPESKSIVLKNQSLKCPFCNNTTFQELHTRLNQKYMALFDMELFSKSGTAYICNNCGLKQEFFDPQKIGRGYYRWGIVLWIVLIIVFILLSILSGQ